MILRHRLPRHLLVICSFSLFFILFTIRHYLLAPPCHDRRANQTLHRLINKLPVNRLVLRSPQYYSNKKYGMVLLVITAEHEQEDRDEIRRLWASTKESRMQKARDSLVIFVVGRSSLLDEEAAMYGDLLQIDLEETYLNMVYKIESSFRWVKEKVDSEFVVKVDSDTVVHIDRLYRQLRRNEMEDRGDWLACYSWPQASLIRDKCSPWYISELDYAHDFFPPYCRGAGYAMRRKTFDKIVDRMKRHKVVEVEDAFFTGIVADDLANVAFKDEIIAFQYTDFSNCDDNGPTLSMLTTHNQFGATRRKNLTAAWERLKKPYCHNLLTWLLEK